MATHLEINPMAIQSPNSEAVESLAAEIGEAAYLDVAKWHLYLANAHLHLPLAEKLYPSLLDRSFSRPKLLHLLADLSVPVGGGKRSIPLVELLPDRQIDRLYQAIEDYRDAKGL